MEFVLRLNRRHKTALFLTLLAAGTSLLIGADVKQACGVALLGLAFAWALGSNNRVVHALFIAIGVLLAAGPLPLDWNTHQEQASSYQEQLADFERKIPDMAKSYPIVDPMAPSRVPSGLMLSRQELANQVKNSLPSYRKLPDKAAVDAFLKKYPMWETILLEGESGPSKNSPKWWNDAFDAGVNVAALGSSQVPGNPPAAFTLSESLSKNWMIEAPGVVLMLIGVGLVLEVKPQEPR